MKPSLALAPIAMLLLGACDGLLGGVSRDEVAWANAPDGRTRAILLETNGGATTSFGYEVELYPADQPGEKPVFAGSLYAAVRRECAFGLDLHWIDANTLALRFDRAENVRIPASVDVGSRKIRIVAQPGISNSDAPCGGMAANRPGGERR